MTNRTTPAATIAFDRLAPMYDVLAGGDAFLHQREQTHAAFSRWLRPGCRVLEIGCGTGVDTEFLALRGVHVVGCDPSEEMLTKTRRRLEASGVGDRVGLLACGLQELPNFLDALDQAQGFDAIVSNFGAINCVECLEPLGRVADSHVRPGGAAILTVMGRSCAWEAVYFAATGRPRLASRRRQAAVMVPVAGVDVPTYYHRIRDVGAVLGASYSLDAVKGIGVIVPPPYLESRWQQVPSVVRRLTAQVDRVVSPLPGVNRLGDHVMMRWVKTRSAHA